MPTGASISVRGLQNQEIVRGQVSTPILEAAHIQRAAFETERLFVSICSVTVVRPSVSKPCLRPPERLPNVSTFRVS